MQELEVEIDGKNSVDPAEKRIECCDGIELVLTNSGPPAHTHLAFTNPLDEIFTINENNIYVEGEKTVELLTGPVGETSEGYLEMTTGYGSNTERVRIVVEPEMEMEEQEPVHEVEVDESLAEPRGEIKVERDMSEKAVMVGVAVAVLLLLIAGAVLEYIWLSIVIIAAVVVAFLFWWR
ncbi:MAG: hypothetical protein ABEK59_04035 [Halobacteria archaeon]